MSAGASDLAEFSRTLDLDWLRHEVGAALSRADVTADDDVVFAQLSAADPLAPRRSWRETFADLVGTWPGRLAVAGATCALVLAGFLAGRAVDRRLAPEVATPGSATGRARVADPVTGIPPTPVYSPEHERRLAAAGPSRGEEKFREAMAAYGAPDFPTRALPALRDAVALDPTYDPAQFWLGVVLILDGRASEAVGPLEDAVRLAPASAMYRQYLVWAYLRTGDLDRALARQTELLRQR